MELELRNGDYIADGVGGLRRVGAGRLSSSGCCSG